MRYKRSVARIGVQLLRWFQVEWKCSVATDGNSCGVVPSESETEVEIAFHSVVIVRSGLRGFGQDTHCACGGRILRQKPSTTKRECDW
jgi:hypothetical protein